MLARVLLGEVVGERQHIGFPLSERRNEDGKDIEPVIQVLPEAAVRQGLLQVPVGGCDDSDIGVDRLASP